MARLTNNVLGPFKGKLGTLVGSSWKGIHYVKSLPSVKRNRKVSELEMANRKRFANSQKWLGPVTDFVRVGFKGYTSTYEGFVAAKSYLSKNAMQVDGTIDPALMKVSHGDLPLPADIAVSLNGENLVFTWEAPRQWQAGWEDQVMVLAYDIEKGIATYSVNGELRRTGQHELKLYSTGRTYHIYFAMVAADRSRQSDSVYLGTIDS